MTKSIRPAGIRAVQCTQRLPIMCDQCNEQKATNAMSRKPQKPKSLGRSASHQPALRYQGIPNPTQSEKENSPPIRYVRKDISKAVLRAVRIICVGTTIKEVSLAMPRRHHLWQAAVDLASFRSCVGGASREAQTSPTRSRIRSWISRRIELGRAVVPGRIPRRSAVAGTCV